MNGIEFVPFGGWARCARLVSGDLEAIVTLEVGPRILRFGFIDGPNELAAYERHAGMTGGDSYRSYGGHRLWTAPEIPDRTYEADNQPVELDECDNGVVLTTPLGPTGLRKQMRLRMDASGPRLLLDHRIRNLSGRPVTIAPWCVTVMAPGGVCIAPQPKSMPHSEALLPAGPLVLWRYTRMADPRWTWGDRVVRLRQDAALGPQKFGARVEQGIAAYANHGNVFVKRFPFDAQAGYPDMGCNFEAFTREDMLEVESLGPLATIPENVEVQHAESWHLYRDVKPPAGDEPCGRWIDELAESTSLGTS